MKNRLKIKWGIIGTGMISNQFAKGILATKNGNLNAVASRSLEKAETFKKHYKVEKAYGNYEDLVKDENIDVVYIGTPHTYHKEHMKLCIMHGKHVLCEKPFTLNADDAEEIILLAKKHNVFLMEAMWTKFLPTTRKVIEWVDNGSIGDIRMIQANFGFRSDFNPDSRLFNPKLGGGSLLDVGIYPITYTTMLLGLNPKTITSSSDIGTTGVDEQASIIMTYENGEIASLNCALRTELGSKATIYGTKGRIEIDNFFMAEKATLIENGTVAKEYVGKFIENGYEYEAEEVGNCILNGKLESDLNPLSHTVSILNIMDEIRSQWSLVYPAE